MDYLSELAEHIRLRTPASLVPEDSDALFLLYAILARAKGTSVTAADVHDAWSAWMALSGKSHASMVPFEELDPEIQAQDMPFLSAIVSVAGRQPQRDSRRS